MEYLEITEDMVKELNKAVSDNSYKDFFETLGFDVHEYEDEVELSGVHTKGGVEMVIDLEKDNWISSFVHYYNYFDVDEQIDTHRQDERYCKDFTCRESVEDFEDWDDYIGELVNIVCSEGKYEYRKHLMNNTAQAVIIFEKGKFKIEELDKMDDSELIDLSYHSNGAKRLGLDEFADFYNYHSYSDLDNYYIKFINK